MIEKINKLLIVAEICSIALVFMLLVTITAYQDNNDWQNQKIDYWHNKCDSLLYKNGELYEKVYILQDSILILRYK